MPPSPLCGLAKCPLLGALLLNFLGGRAIFDSIWFHGHLHLLVICGTGSASSFRICYLLGLVLFECIFVSCKVQLFVTDRRNCLLVLFKLQGGVQRVTAGLQGGPGDVGLPGADWLAADVAC